GCRGASDNLLMLIERDSSPLSGHIGYGWSRPNGFRRRCAPPTRRKIAVAFNRTSHTHVIHSHSSRAHVQENAPPSLGAHPRCGAIRHQVDSIPYHCVVWQIPTQGENLAAVWKRVRSVAVGWPAKV